MQSQSPDPGHGRLLGMMNSFPDAIVLTGLDGKIVQVNEKALKMYGADNMEQLMGISYLDLIAARDREIVAEEIQHARESNSSRWFEARISTLDGQESVFELSEILIRDPSGEPSGILGIARDITSRKKTEEDLRSHRAYYGDILEDQIDLISRFDPNGIMTYANSSYRRFFAPMGEELIGQSLEGFIHPEEYKRLFHRLSLLTPENPVVTHTHTEYHPDGSLGWFMWTNRAIFNEDGKLIEYQGVGRDVSEQVEISEELEKRVQERTRELEAVNRELANEIAFRKMSEEALRVSEARYRILAEASQDYIYVLSGEGRIEYVNNRACVWIRRSREEIIGHFPQEFLPEGMEINVIPLLESILQNGEAIYREELIDFPDRPMWLGSWMIPIPNYAGTSPSVLGISRDITDRMQIEHELQKMLEKERELGDLKTRFITMTSHEFRTPLSTILSSAELLEHYGCRFTEQKKIEHLQRIETAVKHLTTMLDEVLIIGRVDAGKVEVQPKVLDLVEFCHTLIEEIQLSGREQHKIQFYCPGVEIEVCLDEALLRQIVGNLLSNALKFSPPESPVWLEVQEEENQVAVSVQDEGFGIPFADRERMFEPFYRGENVSHIPGTGLGLSIVRRSVDLMHGTIQVISEEGAGAQFKVLLPKRLEVG